MIQEAAISANGTETTVNRTAEAATPSHSFSQSKWRGPLRTPADPAAAAGHNDIPASAKHSSASGNPIASRVETDTKGACARIARAERARLVRLSQSGSRPSTAKPKNAGSALTRLVDGGSSRVTVGRSLSERVTACPLTRH